MDPPSWGSFLVLNFFDKTNLDIYYRHERIVEKIHYSIFIYKGEIQND